MPKTLPPRSFPWEMLAYIYSYCDAETLAALSLVSFGSWQTAGPILYETVEVRSLDSLKSLFFLEDAPPTARLDPTVSLLARIKALTIDVAHWDQKMDPVFDLPAQEFGGEREVFDNSDSNSVDFVLHTPHRLLRAASDGLSIHQLILPESPEQEDPDISGSLPLLSKQLFPHLNPRTVVHTDPTEVPEGGLPLQWMWSSIPIDPAFLSHWRDLECVIVKGKDTICLSTFEHDGLEAPLYSLWLPPPPSTPGALDRGLELVFDFTAWVPSFVEAFVEEYPHRRLDWYLDRGGVTEGLERRVRLRVPPADESVIREEVGKLEEWMKQLVVVEVA